MRLARALAVLLGVATLVALALVGVSQTAWFREWMRGVIVSESADYLNGQLAIGRIDGNLVTGLELRDVVVLLDGEPLVASENVALKYNLWQILTSGVSIDEIHLSSPSLVLREDSDGWTLARLVKGQGQQNEPGGMRPIRVDRFAITNGTIHVHPASNDGAVRLPEQVQDLTLEASFSIEPDDFAASVSELSFRTTGPDFAIRELTGDVSASGDTIEVDDLVVRTDESALSIDGDVQHYLSDPVVNLRVISKAFSIPELSRLLPALSSVPVDPSFDVAVEGPLERLNVTLDVSSSAGAAKASIVADLADPGQAASGTWTLTNVNLGLLLGDADLKSDISGSGSVDLRSDDPNHALDTWRGSVVATLGGTGAGYAVQRLNATARLTDGAATIDATALAYGTTLTTTGRASLPGPDNVVRFDLRGSARRINIRALPSSIGLPRVQTNVNLTYHVTGRQRWDGRSGGPNLTADLDFEESTMPGVTVMRGSTVHVMRAANALDYRADARLDDVNLHAIGEAFGVDALRDERLRTVIDGQVSVSGRGLTRETLAVDASGTISEASAMEGTLRDLTFTARMADATADVTASGAFASVNPAILTGRPDAEGRLDGTLSIEARATDVWNGVTLDTVSGSALMTLDSATAGALRLERATLQADYRDRTATIRELKVVGPDANLSASGTVALDREGESRLAFTMDSPQLGTVGQIFGVPIAGIARAEGTVTGNGVELRGAGTFEGDNLTYGENGALTLRSSFGFSIPDLTVARATATADSHATFVQIAGQRLNELTATTAYEDQRLAFTLTARQPDRQLDATGAVAFRPDHQELHFERVAVQVANQTWRIPDGSDATITYGANIIGVTGLRLVNGDQEVRAEGRAGGEGETLQVFLNNVDLAALEALLLQEPRLSGRLNGSAAVSGTTEAPVVVAEFSVLNGGFRDFKYESFGGRLDAKGGGITIDTRLQQDDAQWITARGYVPMALLPGATSESVDAGGHLEAVSDADRLDVTIDSSPLGLGLVQGVTSQVTDVTGTLEAHVHLTGSVADPHPQGTITIANGAMTVPANGATYTNIAGRVDLQGDRVHIEQITILDDDQSALSITGDLAVHSREVGGVQLWINAEDFRVLDNEMGDLRVYVAAEVAGDLRAPTLRGDAGVSIGRVDLDALMAAAGPSAYPLPASQGTSPQDGSSATGGDAESGSWFDALQMDLRLGIPDDLVVRSTNLQPPGASIGLGALNVTLGGNITAQKAPAGPIRLTGQVNTIRGTYDFQGRRFDILRDGTIRFDGSEEFSPILDIRARRQIQGVEALVGVRGTINAPEVVLSSSPPLEQADILALIVFNQPINQLGEGEQLSLASRARSLAVGAVAGQLAQSIGQALSVDTFEIAVDPDSGATAQFTVGQQVGRDLYFKIEQGVGEAASTNLVIEYALRRWLRLQTNVMEGASAPQALFRRRQGSGIDLIVLFDR